MRKIVLVFLCPILLFSCAALERKSFKEWNKLIHERKILSSETKVVFSYNVSSSLKKNVNKRFFKDIDSTFVMKLKTEFIEKLSNNYIKAEDSLYSSRFQIEVTKFDFIEDRHRETLEHDDMTDIADVSNLEIHFLGSIVDTHTQERKEIKIDEKHRTMLGTSVLSKYFVVERGENINVNTRISNIAIEFSNKCSEFIKEAD